MKKHAIWWAPLLFFGLLAPFTPSLDLFFSDLFYVGERTFFENGLTHFLYKYGEIFGLISGVIALIFFGLTFVQPRWKVWRRGALALVLTLVLGAGIITNALFKEFWGRPRPKQVVEFGGHHTYRPFWQPNFQSDRDPQKSFPSGHAAMGFYFISLCYVGRRYQSRKLFYLGVLLTLGLGGGLMITRVVQGGHFFSDVIASLVVMWFVAWAVDRILFTSAVSEGLSPSQGHDDTFVKPAEP